MKDALKVYAPIALLVLALTIIAMRMVAPPPPKTISFAAGSKDGQYFALAERYQSALEAHGIAVEIIESKGTIENYALLLDGKADVALLQGGLADGAQRAAVRSLGGMFAEPYWMFVLENTEVNGFGDLNTLNIAAGPMGSGTRALTERLQAEWGGDWGPLSQLAGNDAAAALLSGDVDAVVYSASVEAPYVNALLANPLVQLVPMRRANGLSMRDPALEPTVLFEGVVDMEAGLPQADIKLLSSIAQLGVSKDLHPAIQSVLLETAEPIHSQGTIMTRAGIYPNASQVDLALSDEARRYYRNGPTFLRRYFSFGWANFLERAWVFLLPLAAALIPLVQMAPPIYRWRIRRKIYVWYNDLHELERRGIEAESKGERQAVLDEIHNLQMEVGTVDVPVSYNDELYHLRSHINFVEALIARQKVTRP
jgi:hypothetical protein